MLDSFDILVDQISDIISRENFKKIRTAINDLIPDRSFWTVVYVTNAYASRDLDEVHADTKLNDNLFRITLLSNPKINARIRVIDAESYFNTKNVIIDGNGKNINGSTTLTLSTADDNREFVYNGRQWKALRL